MTGRHLFGGIALSAVLAASAASAAELRFTCYQDGVECDAWAEQLKTFESENPGNTVAIDVVPYQAILESLASEHSARMVSMRSASDNAKEIVNELTLSRNKARQAQITQEVSEIAAGANAMAG